MRDQLNRNLMSDCYRLLEHAENPPQTEWKAWFEEIVRMSEDISNRYPGNPFAVHLPLAVVLGAEDKWKAEGGGECDPVKQLLPSL